MKNPEPNNALYYLNVLPSNQREIDAFISKLKNEILIHPYRLKVLKQLKMVEKLIAEINENADIAKYFYLDAKSYGLDVLPYDDDMTVQLCEDRSLQVILKNNLED